LRQVWRHVSKLIVSIKQRDGFVNPRLLSFTPQFEFLKNKGTNRRRDLPKTMEKRNAVHRETLKKWKAIRTERSNQMKKPETTPPENRRIEPGPGTEQKTPPKKTMENRIKLQHKEGIEPKEKPRPRPKVDAPEKRDTIEKPTTQAPGKGKVSSKNP